MYHYKPCVHTNSLYIQDNQKPLKVVNTASPYCSFEDCATKLNYEYAWLIYQAEVNIVNIDFTMHDIKETGARSTSGHTFKQAIWDMNVEVMWHSVLLPWHNFCNQSWNSGYSMNMRWKVFDYYILASLICHSILVVNLGQLHQTKFVFLSH